MAQNNSKSDVFMHTHPVLDQRTSASDNAQSTFEKKHSDKTAPAADSELPPQPNNPVTSEASQAHHKQQKDAEIEADDAAELERKEQSRAAKEANKAQAEAEHQ